MKYNCIGLLAVISCGGMLGHAVVDRINIILKKFSKKLNFVFKNYKILSYTCQQWLLLSIHNQTRHQTNLLHWTMSRI